MFTFQKISNYGTGSPAVARTFVQGCEILEWFDCSEPKKAAAKELLFDLQRHLLKCVELRDGLSKEIDNCLTALDSRAQDSDQRSIAIPGVGDLLSKAESFLASAKLAISVTGNLVEPFYGVANGHKYQKVAAWAEAEFGDSDPFAVLLKSWQPFVKRIVQMRNCVDHPRTEPGAPLIVRDFTLDKGEMLVTPQWGLTGEPLVPILDSFDQIFENTICLGESILGSLFQRLKMTPLVTIAVIPEDQRDSSNPKRLKIVLSDESPPLPPTPRTS